MDAAQNTHIRLEREGALAIITLDGPSKRNALGADARGALRATVQQVMYHEPDVRAIVLTGAGGHFCAGADVQQFTKNSRVRGRFNVSQSGETMSELAGGPKPVVAAVEGIAYGMGLSFAVACDLLVAARNARLCAVFARIGLLPDTGILWSLPKKIGMNHAREMLTLAREVGGEEALSMGLVNQLVEPGQALQEAKKLALELAELPPLAVAHTKSALTWRGESFHDSLRAELDCGAGR
ncbi:MAG TPA: enoyl-CoA hydratase/isomerase family protein [Ramlibacter sp.]|nr:enoyl-CoA hydratase/isomerase family protein [Ramlibacter sp.]